MLYLCYVLIRLRSKFIAKLCTICVIFLQIKQQNGDNQTLKQEVLNTHAVLAHAPIVIVHAK